MDTDSYYLALSATSLDDVIRPSLTENFQRIKYTWSPRTDTPEANAYTRRTPGLFKIEMQGDCMVSLCAKTYCVAKLEYPGERENM